MSDKSQLIKKLIVVIILGIFVLIPTLEGAFNLTPLAIHINTNIFGKLFLYVISSLSFLLTLSAIFLELHFFLKYRKTKGK